jgi:hypothetical protein
MPAIPTAAIPSSQQHGFVRIENAAVTAMPRRPLGERRALEVTLHGASTEAHLLGHGVQCPPPLMIRPDLVVVGPPLGPPLARQACRRGGRLGRGERHPEAGPGAAAGSVGSCTGVGAARGGVTRASWEAWAVKTWVNVSARFCSR